MNIFRYFIILYRTQNMYQRNYYIILYRLGWINEMQTQYSNKLLLPNPVYKIIHRPISLVDRKGSRASPYVKILQVAQCPLTCLVIGLGCYQKIIQSFFDQIDVSLT